MDKLKSFVSPLYNTVVVGNQKALVGFALSGVALLGVSVGGVDLLDASVRDVVTAVVGAVVTAGGVWFKANK